MSVCCGRNPFADREEGTDDGATPRVNNGTLSHKMSNLRPSHGRSVSCVTESEYIGITSPRSSVLRGAAGAGRQLFVFPAGHRDTVEELHELPTISGGGHPCDEGLYCSARNPSSGEMEEGRSAAGSTCSNSKHAAGKDTAGTSGEVRNMTPTENVCARISSKRVLPSTTSVSYEKPEENMAGTATRTVANIAHHGAKPSTLRALKTRATVSPYSCCQDAGPPAVDI